MPLYWWRSPNPGSWLATFDLEAFPFQVAIVEVEHQHPCPTNPVDLHFFSNLFRGVQLSSAARPEGLTSRWPSRRPSRPTRRDSSAPRPPLPNVRDIFRCYTERSDGGAENKAFTEHLRTRLIDTKSNPCFFTAAVCGWEVSNILLGIHKWITSIARHRRPNLTVSAWIFTIFMMKDKLIPCKRVIKCNIYDWELKMV